MISRRNLAAAMFATAATGARAQNPDPLAGRFGGPFALTASDGRRVTDRDFAGRFMLVYFGYTRCPDVCPVDLLVMAEALKALGPDAARIQPLFITVDPARDTPASLADYAGSFDPRILGLSGSEEEIAAALRAYKVHRVKYIPAGHPEDYGIDHSSLTYLMGPDGVFRTLIPHGGKSERMKEIVAGYLAKG